MSVYHPEGLLIDTAENRKSLASLEGLRKAMDEDKTLEARVTVCDSAHNLILDLGCCRGLIPRSHTVLGIDTGATRDIAIISRVNKPVSFLVTGFETDTQGNTIVLGSRRLLQERCRERYLNALSPGDIIPAKVTHLESFGCFVDVGCGVTSLIPIDSISVSRISHPRDRFYCGQEIFAVVRSADELGRLTLTHKELLGTWEENAALFRPGETVAGIVRSVEKYGVFIELTPNLAGLAETREEVTPGQHASVYIKSLLPDKMKVKLIIVDAFDAAYPPEPPRYQLTQGHIDRWRYSPEVCPRVIETVFCGTADIGGS